MAHWRRNRNRGNSDPKINCAKQRLLELETEPISSSDEEEEKVSSREPVSPLHGENPDFEYDSVFTQKKTYSRMLIHGSRILAVPSLGEDWTGWTEDPFRAETGNFVGNLETRVYDVLGDEGRRDGSGFADRERTGTSSQSILDQESYGRSPPLSKYRPPSNSSSIHSPAPDDPVTLGDSLLLHDFSSERIIASSSSAFYLPPTPSSTPCSMPVAATPVWHAQSSTAAEFLCGVSSADTFAGSIMTSAAVSSCAAQLWPPVSSGQMSNVGKPYAPNAVQHNQEGGWIRNVVDTGVNIETTLISSPVNMGLESRSTGGPNDRGVMTGGPIPMAHQGVIKDPATGIAYIPVPLHNREALPEALAAYCAVNQINPFQGGIPVSSKGVCVSGSIADPIVSAVPNSVVVSSIISQSSVSSLARQSGQSVAAPVLPDVVMPAVASRRSGSRRRSRSKRSLSNCSSRSRSASVCTSCCSCVDCAEKRFSRRIRRKPTPASRSHRSRSRSDFRKKRTSPDEGRSPSKRRKRGSSTSRRRPLRKEGSSRRSRSRRCSAEPRKRPRVADSSRHRLDRSRSPGARKRPRPRSRRRSLSLHRTQNLNKSKSPREKRRSGSPRKRRRSTEKKESRPKTVRTTLRSDGSSRRLREVGGEEVRIPDLLCPLKDERLRISRDGRLKTPPVLRRQASEKSPCTDDEPSSSKVEKELLATKLSRKSRPINDPVSHVSTERPFVEYPSRTSEAVPPLEYSTSRRSKLKPLLECFPPPRFSEVSDAWIPCEFCDVKPPLLQPARLNVEIQCKPSNPGKVPKPVPSGANSEPPMIELEEGEIVEDTPEDGEVTDLDDSDCRIVRETVYGFDNRDTTYFPTRQPLFPPRFVGLSDVSQDSEAAPPVKVAKKKRKSKSKAKVSKKKVEGPPRARKCYFCGLRGHAARECLSTSWERIKKSKDGNQDGSDPATISTETDQPNQVPVAEEDKRPSDSDPVEPEANTGDTQEKLPPNDASEPEFCAKGEGEIPQSSTLAAAEDAKVHVIRDTNPIVKNETKPEATPTSNPDNIKTEAVDELSETQTEGCSNISDPAKNRYKEEPAEMSAAFSREKVERDSASCSQTEPAGAAEAESGETKPNQLLNIVELKPILERLAEEAKSRTRFTDPADGSDTDGSDSIVLLWSSEGDDARSRVMKDDFTEPVRKNLARETVTENFLNPEAAASSSDVVENWDVPLFEKFLLKKPVILLSRVEEMWRQPNSGVSAMFANVKKLSRNLERPKQELSQQRHFGNFCPQKSTNEESQETLSPGKLTSDRITRRIVAELTLLGMKPKECLAAFCGSSSTEEGKDWKSDVKKMIADRYSVDLMVDYDWNPDQDASAETPGIKKLLAEERQLPTAPGRAVPSKRLWYQGGTLLEKLLQDEIVRERNMMLQCIRYIVANKFFLPDDELTPEERERAAALKPDEGEIEEDDDVAVVKEEPEDVQGPPPPPTMSFGLGAMLQNLVSAEGGPEATPTSVSESGPTRRSVDFDSPVMTKRRRFEEMISQDETDSGHLYWGTRDVDNDKYYRAPAVVNAADNKPLAIEQEPSKTEDFREPLPKSPRPAGSESPTGEAAREAERLLEEIEAEFL